MIEFQWTCKDCDARFWNSGQNLLPLCPHCGGILKWLHRDAGRKGTSQSRASE